MTEDAILIVVNNTQDEQGFPIEETLEYPVYVRERSVKYSEYYEALRSGYTPKIILEMRIEDWEQTRHLAGEEVAYATKVKYDEGTYTVLRYYRTNRATMQVTCGSREVGYR